MTQWKIESMKNRAPRTNRVRRAAAGVVLPVVLLGLSACSSAEGEDELPAIVETTDEALEEDSGATDSFGDYAGVYDREFYDDVEFYVGEEVTVAAIVGEVVSSTVFTITDVAPAQDVEEDPVDIDEVVIEPLLVVHEDEIPGLVPGTPVGVVGVVREEFYREAVEEELGADLDDAAFERWEEQPYIELVRAEALGEAAQS